MPTKPPPPANFIAAKSVQWAHFVPENPPFLRPKRKATGRRAAGIRYEAQVQERLCAAFPYSYLPNPWIKFEGHAGIKWCQPDGLLFDLEEGLLAIVEVKYQHTTDAWWQLRELYEPVIRKLFPQTLWRIVVLEYVKWFDPLVPWPEGIQMIAQLAHVSKIQENQTGIHIWRP